jgi:endonuclease/exonuclease/phosphatase family metal-dependent hydrolase
MTFNVRGSTFKEDGVNQWKHRADLNVRTIANANPDLIGFQEFQKGNLATYRQRLPQYSYITGHRYMNEEAYMYPAIFWRPSRLQLLEWGGFWLSSTPDRPVPDWGAELVRSANWARFRTRSDGAVFLHLNTHLDHLSERSRVESGKLILAKLSELQADGSPAVVTGDFNRSSGSPVYTLFTDAGFIDTYREAGGAETHTAHAFRGPDLELPPGETGRLDWILVRGGRSNRSQTVSCTVLRDAEPPLYPSDHYPVVAELELP